MSNATTAPHSILPGDTVLVVKGRNQGLGKVTMTSPRSVLIDGSWVLASSIDPRSIKTAIRARALAEADVTWEWLTETMTAAEADAWLGL